MATALTDAVEAPTAPVDAPLAAPSDRIGRLMERAAGAQGDARRVAAGELNSLMVALARHPSRPVADALLKVLDGGALSELEDAEGITSRAAAASALLSMGYPYALEISPEDLEHLRQRSPSNRPLGTAVAATVVVAVTCGLGALEVFSGPSWNLLEAGALCVQAAAAVALALSNARSAVRTIASLALLFAGLAALSLSFQNQTLAIPGAGALAAFALTWRPKRR